MSSKVVRDVFRVFFIMFLVMTLCTVVLEYLNVQTNAHRIKGYMKTGIYQSCLLFSDESFARCGNPQTYFPILYGTKEGSDDTYTSGYNGATLNVANQIYGGNTTEEAIWNYLYSNAGYTIQQFANGTGVTNTAGSVVMPKDYFINLNYLLQDSFIGEIYRDYHYTPMNLGIPYLEPNTITGMSKWMVTELMSEGKHIANLDSEATSGLLDGTNGTKQTITNLHRDNKGVYILWKGFRIYIDELEVQVNYKLLDMNSEEDMKVYSDTLHISAGEVFSDNALTNTDTEIQDSIDNERYAMVAYLTYKVPIRYEGITPWRRFATWMLSGAYGAEREVSGEYTPNTDRVTDEEMLWDGGKQVSGARGYKDANAEGEALAGQANKYKLENSLGEMTGGGDTSSTNGETGRIVFSITR